jgi:hypothetical protein
MTATDCWPGIRLEELAADFDERVAIALIAKHHRHADQLVERAAGALIVRSMSRKAWRV